MKQIIRIDEIQRLNPSLQSAVLDTGEIVSVTDSAIDAIREGDENLELEFTSDRYVSIGPDKGLTYVGTLRRLACERP